MISLNTQYLPSHVGLGFWIVDPFKVIQLTIFTSAQYVTPDSKIYCEKVNMFRKLVFLHQISATCRGW